MEMIVLKNPIEKERNRILAKMSEIEDPSSQEYQDLEERLQLLNQTLAVDKKGKIEANTAATLLVQGGIFALVYLLTKTDILPNWIGRWFPKGKL